MTLKFTRNEMMLFREAVQKAIDHYNKEIASEYDDHYCCVKAVLDELCIKLIRDTIVIKDKYTVKLNTYQGFAFRSAFAAAKRKDYTGKWLGNICDQIHFENANKLSSIDPGRLALPEPHKI
jgi:hypothetical protein